MATIKLVCSVCGEEAKEYNPDHPFVLPPGWALRVDKENAWCPKHAKPKKTDD